MPPSLTPWFVSTTCVVSSLADEFAPPNLTETSLAYDFMHALACAFFYTAFQSAHVLSESAQYFQLSLVCKNLLVVSIAFDANSRSVSPCLLLGVLEHIYILGDALDLEVIALQFIAQRQKVEGVTARAPHL